MKKVKCSKCGELKYANPKVYASRLAKYGTVEKMESEWICKNCKPKKEKKVELNPEEKKKENLKIAKSVIRESIKTSN